MLLRRTFSSAARKATDWNQYADFFQFTRGRFVSREAENTAQRYIRFNMNALCRVAGESVGKKCVSVEKFADGMYNEAFLMTMDDDHQVVAKVPNPNAGQPHLTTASEVATMDFMRNVLDTPAPQVLAWSSDRRNTVDAEYIIMEKAPGVQLTSTWPSLDSTQKAQVVRSVARLQRAWTKISFQQVGSLYYTEDVDRRNGTAPLYIDRESGSTVDSARYAIGPIQGREWMDHGRAALDCDRGPWPSIESYKRAEIERDMLAIRSTSELPQPLTMLCGPSLYQPDRQKKLHAGQLALQALPHAMPFKESPFNLWHDDLHVENIFVREDDPTEIVAVIDWQSSVISPLFDHTILPGFLEYEGPPVQGMERPAAPEFPKGTSDEARATSWALFEHQTLASGFKHLLRNAIPPAYDALKFQESEDFHFLAACRSILVTSEAYCLASVAALEGTPVKFSEAETMEIQHDLEATEASINAMDKIREHLGDLFPEKGIVRHEEYQDSKAALRMVKEEVIEDFSASEEDRRAWEKAWPFDD